MLSARCGAVEQPGFYHSTDRRWRECQTALMEMIRTSAVGTTRPRLVACQTSTPPIAAPVQVTRSTTTVPTLTLTEEPGPKAFLSIARAMDYGDRDMSTGTDDELLEIGNAACCVLKTHRSFDAAVKALVKATGKPTLEQAQSLMRDSVLNLCPQQKNLLPKPQKALGAPSKTGWLTQHIKVPLNR